MKKIILITMCAGLLAITGCNNINDEIAKDLQEIESTTIDFAYTANGRTITFTNMSDTKVSDLTWDFGDGNGSKATHPEHAYYYDGTYKVVLKGTWKFDGHLLNKNCEKTITVKQSAQTYSKMYISGFKLYSGTDISGSYYYRFECACHDLMGGTEPNIKTDYSGIKLNANNMPYTMTLNPSVLLGDFPDPLDWYSTFDVRVFFAANIGENVAVALNKTIQASDIPNGATEYVVTNPSNGAKVAILFSYK